MVWCLKEPSHYQSWCWPRFMSPYYVTRAQWVNEYGKTAWFNKTTSWTLFDDSFFILWYLSIFCDWRTGHILLQYISKRNICVNSPFTYEMMLIITLWYKKKSPLICWPPAIYVPSNCRHVPGPFPQGGSSPGGRPGKNRTSHPFCPGLRGQELPSHQNILG